MRRVLVIVGLLLVGSSKAVWAQPHPCDTPSQTGGSGTVDVGAFYTLSWCQPALDDGATFKLYVNGGTGMNLVPVSGTISGTGYREYFVSNRAERVAGTFTLEVSAVNSEGRESAKSAPFALTAARAAPSRPTNLSIRLP